MGKIIFLLGGARSGKSRYAVELAKRLKKMVVFIATAIASDTEMRQRVKLHRLSRPRHWRLIEESKDISSILSKIDAKYKVVLIDCLGLWISNLLIDKLGDREIKKKIKRFLTTIAKAKFTTILVSNEVGCGIVPDNYLARKFQDLIGFVNQTVAKYADEVISMVSGIPVRIKGEEDAKNK